MERQNKYLHKNTSVSLINYHFVWIPKRRKKVLIGDVAKRLEELLYLQCKTILALEIMSDHVHLFLGSPPTWSPHQIMFRLKGYSSKVLREEFPHLLKLYGREVIIVVVLAMCHLKPLKDILPINVILTRPEGRRTTSSRVGAVGFVRGIL